MSFDCSTVRGVYVLPDSPPAIQEWGESSHLHPDQGDLLLVWLHFNSTIIVEMATKLFNRHAAWSTATLNFLMLLTTTIVNDILFT